MEQSFVAWAKMRAHRLPKVALGIGDDAAVLDMVGEQTVVTTDSLMEGVHFDSTTTSWQRIGRKLVAVNLSDLAAMAADPVGVLLSMSLPMQHEQAADVIAAEVFEGVCEAAESFGIAVAGGDTNCWSGPTVLNMTALGRTNAGVAWMRSGAQPDDQIVVTGPLGGSILGRHLDFRPRFDVVQRLRDEVGIHAAMDLSDGLSVDLLRMCDASRCGAILHLDDIPIHEDAIQLSKSTGKTAVEHALGDGEDFELLLAVEPSELQRCQQLMGTDALRVCGTFTSRTGLWAQAGGKLEQLNSTGYVHGQQDSGR